MSFTFPALAVAGAALSVAPIVIHLINLRRRRKVAWGAMDFLLASHRKNRTRILLSEWLLLALRVLAVALAGALAATPQTAELLSGVFGADPTLHYVLLDDTAGMRRRAGGDSAWDEAIASVTRLATTAAESGDRVVVLRSSDLITGSAPQDLSTEGIDPPGWRPTHTTGELRDGVSRLLELLRSAAGGERRYAYLISDYANTACGESAALAEVLEPLASEATGVILAACGDPETPNLAVDTLTLTPGPVAAGVETQLTLGVTNHSDAAVAETAINLRRDGQPLTTLRVGPFEPRQRLAVQTPVVFPSPGVHAITAEAPADRMPADDRCWLGVEVARSHEVLLLDNSARGVESRVLAAALQPSGKTRSGWAPRRVASLSDNDLTKATTVVIADVDRLNATATRNLREYVRGGGGLWLTLGPRVDPDWINRSFAELMPARLGPPATAPTQGALRIADHPAVRVLAGEANPLLPLVRVSIARRQREENPTTEAPTEATTLIGFDDGSPLMLGVEPGRGRVTLLATSPSRGETGDLTPWSNLSTLPIFPVLVNDTIGWLAHPKLRPRSETVGGMRPAAVTESSQLWRWSTAGTRESALGLGPAAPLLPAEPGIYWRELDGVAGKPFAASIDPAESDLSAASVGELSTRWDDLARVARANDLFQDTQTPASRTPLYVAASALLVVLAMERLLALAGSYVGAAAPQQGAPV